MCTLFKRSTRGKIFIDFTAKRYTFSKAKEFQEYKSNLKFQYNSMKYFQFKKTSAILKYYMNRILTICYLYIFFVSDKINQLVHCFWLPIKITDATPKVLHVDPKADAYPTLPAEEPTPPVAETVAATAPEPEHPRGRALGCRDHLGHQGEGTFPRGLKAGFLGVERGRRAADGPGPGPLPKGRPLPEDRPPARVLARRVRPGAHSPTASLHMRARVRTRAKRCGRWRRRALGERVPSN